MPGQNCKAVELHDLSDAETTRVRRLLAILTTEQPSDLQDMSPDWADREGRILIEAMPELLAWHDRYPPERVSRMVAMMRMRAWSRVVAKQRAAVHQNTNDMAGKVHIAQHRHAYADFFAMHEYDLSYPRFDGSMSPIVTRGVFQSCDATLVLPYDPVRDCVLLVEQFRIGVHARGSANPWILEPVAGLIDPGESPETTAHREAMEEAGLTFAALHPIARAHPSPGAGTEFFHKFLGIADLPKDAAGLGGLASEAEDIRSHILSYDDFIARIDADEFAAGPLVLMGLWLARHRDRLRGDAAAG